MQSFCSVILLITIPRNRRCQHGDTSMILYPDDHSRQPDSVKIQYNHQGIYIMMKYLFGDLHHNHACHCLLINIKVYIILKFDTLLLPVPGRKHGKIGPTNIFCQCHTNTGFFIFQLEHRVNQW